ncbi:MAG: hypothetical protein J0665_13305 [Deltaproteobacteria bacterium]|nr:hypothetical protein [Deltaproteobacteria bacterium]
METNQSVTYLTTEELAGKLHYAPRYILNCLKDSVLFEGIHYIKPFGRRKILYLWEAIERDMLNSSAQEIPMIPMARGGICHG